MANESLPLKYRPQTFDALIGQESSVVAFLNLVRLGIGKNTILHGYHGSGKTSSARIYSRALNCLNPQDGNPCNTCENCKMFFENRYTDHIEVDGASRGKVDDIDSLLAIARQKPLLGKWRIIIVDEAQGLSRQAWDKLLKILEEPPPWVVFIFTTTEFTKVREAVRSRCQCLEVRLLNPQTAFLYLENVCKKEGFDYTKEGLQLIVKVSGGHHRDLLKNLEQVHVLGAINEINTKSAFNLSDQTQIIQVIESILDGDLLKSLRLSQEWNIPAYAKHDLFRRLFLEIHLLEQTGSVMGDEIEQADVVRLHRRMETLSQDVQITLADAVVKTLECLQPYTCQTEVQIDSLISTLIRLIHQQRWDAKSSASKTQTVTSTKSVNRRVFVSTPQKPSVVQPQPVEENIPPVVKKTPSETVYDHTLLTEGFVMVSPKGMTVI